jgi:hypothetical protein
MIRKQAMSKVSAARKQNKSYGKHNLGQFPVFTEVESDKQLAYRSRPRKPIILSRKGSDGSSGDSSSTLSGGSSGDDTAPILESHLDSSLYDYDGTVPPYARKFSITETISANVSPTGLQKVSITYGLDITSLSNLSSLHIGMASRLLDRLYFFDTYHSNNDLPTDPI